ncbi:MAG: type II toxin-antitoxin system RelE/ParE family toxin [Bacteroidales bacterium]|nr:type II toxin-antitoxin system RelE/ParE family toxin [Bacteroidales bacterium]
MKPILFSGKARKDLAEIRIYTESLWSRQQAIRYRDLLIDECFSIPDKEQIISYPTYNDFFYTHCGHHYIFFKSTTREIRIVRILHESMHFIKHLGSPA